ncbi:NAD-dependent dehydratase [Xanthomonas theicola]|uniref:NAD-dependent dehydratase n=1 Tax=Xanthomonas theicola TaxID=56464 RepID=UPI001FE9D923|nr:NAD-dependent dehydratase [Xanthomonas theicola]
MLAQLLAAPACGAVVAPTRRALGAVHPKLYNRLVDFDRLPAQARWWRADAAICALGTTMRQAGSREAFRRVDHAYPLAIARLARQHGATAFALTSAMGADPHARLFYNRVKDELERDLQALGYPALALIRPGLIGGEPAQPRAAERAAAVLGVLGPRLPRRYRISPATCIAAALVAHAVHPRAGVQVVDAAQLAQ